MVKRRVPPRTAVELAKSLGLAEALTIGVQRAPDRDVVIIGAVTKAALEKAVFGSTAERIAAQPPCSVLIARAHQD